MKHLRQYIRQILLETSTLNKLHGADEGQRLSKKWQTLFYAIKNSRLFGLPEPNIDYNKFADGVVRDYRYPTPMSSFVPTFYETFEDYFLRKLSPQTLEKSLESARGSIVCSPAEATVRSFPHESDDGKAIILKNSVIKLANLHLPEGYTPIHYALALCDYHWVHSPVDGVVTAVDFFDHGEISNNSDALCIIKIKNEYGEFLVMCIGECTVQTFLTKIKIGQQLKKMDVLGCFYFGSRVVLLLPPKLAHKAVEGNKSFPGDPIIVPRG